MQMIMAIAAGGAIGAVLRHFVNQGALMAMGSGFPWGTLSVNILGSFCMGILIALFAHFDNPSQEMRAFLTVGVLGAFTTFSTFSLDFAVLWERGDFLSAGLYMAVSVVLAIAGLFAGLYLVRSLVS